jgi:acetyl-CoA acetyltransferase
VNEAVIVGVAESDLGITKKSIVALQAQAMQRALADAGLSLRDVDGFATTGIGGRFDATVIAEYVGISPTWIDSTYAGGASFEIMLSHAAAAIERDEARVVVIAYGSDQRSAGSRKLSGAPEPHLPLSQYEMPYGPLLPISAYAVCARRHMYEYGTTREAMAEVAVAAREWALLNPAAYQYGNGSLSIEDVLAADVVSSPLGRLDCCLVTDGGGAIVMTGRDRAADLPVKPIRILASTELSTHRTLAQMPSLTETGAYDTGARAFAKAGLTPHDIDVVQIYDSFTITAMLSLEGLRFCKPGESGDFVKDQKLRPGGSFPMNTSGGGLSYCHPGMFGIFLLIEAVRQLRGVCGARQVKGAKTALCHATGGLLNTHATVILAGA